MCSAGIVYLSTFVSLCYVYLMQQTFFCFFASWCCYLVNEIKWNVNRNWKRNVAAKYFSQSSNRAEKHRLCRE